MKKKKLCQLCEKRYAIVGFNCKPCNDGIRKRDKQRTDIDSSSFAGYGGWGHD